VELWVGCSSLGWDPVLWAFVNTIKDNAIYSSTKQINNKKKQADKHTRKKQQN
jgi:hypothetical protein